ncbi:CobW family GTP-binding protein [Candidatus Stoquefichus sp. SB1]|uniref:CobW family GTP-binding protein n=1 Tax=Candidatus Stoquefichus sp. SB1 TaxID=1658109 RepID=UPI00067F0475|nr:CobW family GTP-binding protein [Candidatus Stoquefichus sp. SB1]
MSKVDIISGFLGAGKTTLIKKLIKESLSNEKVVLIENEFGEIGIDGSFLKDAGIEITEMNSGCICCSLVGDFSEALEKVVKDYHPDRIIIEPSGVGKLSDVIQAVINVHDEELVLNSFITVIDAKKCKTYSLNFGEFFNNQIEYASSIILSRTQDVDHDKIHTAIDIIKELNQKANIITTPWEELTGETILNALENKDSLKDVLLKEAEICPVCGHHHEHDEHHHEHHHDHDCECKHEHHEHHHDHDCKCGHDHHEHHHHADEVFTSMGKETINTYTHEQLENILKDLSTQPQFGHILRAKGILPTPDKKWLHFDLVPGEYEIRYGPADYTGRLCVIGKDLVEDKIDELFGIA